MVSMVKDIVLSWSELGALSNGSGSGGSGSGRGGSAPDPLFFGGAEGAERKIFDIAKGRLQMLGNCQDVSPNHVTSTQTGYICMQNM